MMAEGKGGARGPACTNAHAQPPELVECGSAKTGQTFVVQVIRPQQPGARGRYPTTSDLKPDFIEPMQIITITDRHLEDQYIEGLLREKGLGESQIARIRSSMRRYIDSFLKGRGIEIDGGAYRVLTNMLMHLIEESSKEWGGRGRGRRCVFHNQHGGVPDGAHAGPVP